MLQGEAGQFVGFLSRDLPQRCCPLCLIRRNDARATIGKPRHDSGDGTGMTRRQSGIDGCKRCTARGTLTGEQQLQLGIMHTDERTA